MTIDNLRACMQKAAAGNLKLALRNHLLLIRSLIHSKFIENTIDRLLTPPLPPPHPLDGSLIWSIGMFVAPSNLQSKVQHTQANSFAVCTKIFRIKFPVIVNAMWWYAFWSLIFASDTAFRKLPNAKCQCVHSCIAHSTSDFTQIKLTILWVEFIV